MHATDSETAEKITPSPAKILFFTPYWSALSQRNEIINSVLSNHHLRGQLCRDALFFSSLH